MSGIIKQLTCYYRIVNLIKLGYFAFKKVNPEKVLQSSGIRSVQSFHSFLRRNAAYVTAIHFFIQHDQIISHYFSRKFLIPFFIFPTAGS